MARADLWLAGAVVVPVGAVAAAYYTQHVWKMDPCPWCVLQRLIFLCIAAAALVALLWRSPLGRRVGATLALGLAGCGIAAALWQHFVAASSASCVQTLADRIISGLELDGRWPDLFMPMASCADAKVNLFGLPYEFWSLGLFVLLALAALAVIRRPR